MPLTPEEPQIHESVPGPRTAPAPGRRAPTPRPVPGPPRPAAPRPAPKPRATQNAGAQFQLIPAPADGAVDAADETVDLLLDSGRPPGEILVLTTGEPHPWAAHELTFGEASYWAQHDAADDVFYAGIEAERARSRPVVVVAVNGGEDEAMPRLLAGALARAGVLLIVCGDPARINAALGATA